MLYDIYYFVCATLLVLNLSNVQQNILWNKYIYYILDFISLEFYFKDKLGTFIISLLSIANIIQFRRDNKISIDLVELRMCRWNNIKGKKNSFAKERTLEIIVKILLKIRHYCFLFAVCHNLSYIIILLYSINPLNNCPLTNCQNVWSATRKITYKRNRND